MRDILRELSAREAEIEDCPVTPEHLAGMVRLIEQGTISNTIAQKVFAEMMASGKRPETIVEEQGLAQVSDTAAIQAAVEAAIAANPDPAEDYRNGKDKALGFLVGKVMQAMKGKGNPQIVNALIRQILRGE